MTSGRAHGRDAGVPDPPVIQRAKRLLEEARANGREPFGWVCHSSVHRDLMATLTAPDPGLRYLSLLRYRMFFCDVLPEGTLELIYAEP
jgi:hypothetical protein